MKKIFLLVICILTMTAYAALPAAALDVSDAVEQSLFDAMRADGIGDSPATAIRSRYAFFGMMMFNRIQLEAASDAVDMLSSASDAGVALGRALAAAYMNFGHNSLYDTATVMLLATRAGVAPKLCADLIVDLARGGYDKQGTVDVVCEISDAVRTLRPDDGGAELCAFARELIMASTTADSVRTEVASLAEREVERQRMLLAAIEEERRRIESVGGGDGSSGGDGGVGDGAGSGGVGSASAGGEGGEGAGDGSADGAGDGDGGSGGAGDGDGGSGAGDGASGEGGAGEGGSGDGGAGDGGEGGSDGSSSE